MFSSNMSSSDRNSSLLGRCVLAVALVIPLMSLVSLSSAAAQASDVGTIEVDPGDSPSEADPTPVWAIVEANSRYYIGGQFITVEGQTQSYLAAVDVATGQLDTAFQPIIAGSTTEVFAIALSPDGSDLYIGGRFSSVNGVPRDRIAKIDAITGELNLAFDPAASATVETIAVDESGVYVGGKFGTIGGASSPNLAKLDTITGQFDPAWTASADGSVLDIELFGDNVYVGGNFTSIAGAAHEKLVQLQSTNGQVQSTWNPLFDPPERVQAIALSADGQTIFAGTAGSLRNSNNGNSVWSYSNTGSRNWQRALGGDVQALETLGDTLFVGTHGDFIFDELRFELDGETLNPNFPADGYVEASSNTNAISREKLLSLDQASGDLLPWDPDLNSLNGVWELESGPSGLLVGGDFTEVANPAGVGGSLDTIEAHHVAIFANPVAVALGEDVPTGTGAFSCTVTVSGNDATITYEGDRGTSNQLLANGSWIGTVTNSTSNTIPGGANDTYSVRARGEAFANPFEEVACVDDAAVVTPPVTPPVEPPVTPPVEPPVTPPVEPPVTPPVPVAGDFACEATANGPDVTISYSGDRGTSNQLLQNSSWIQTVTDDTSTTIAGGAGNTFTVRIRGAAYANPFDDVTCTGDTGIVTPPPPPVEANGDFACVATANGPDVTITYSGDRGLSNQLLVNGSWQQTVTDDTSTTITDGAGNEFTIRIRGVAYADPFQDITCTGDGVGTAPVAGSFACTVTTNGADVTITYSGDRGLSNQLLVNGSWQQTVTDDTSTTITSGAGDEFTIRIRGVAYADPFQDITCN